MPTDTHLRSVLKSISYRVFGTLSTMLISFIFTGSVPISLSIGGVEFVSKFFLYYTHERVWEKIKFGKIKDEK